MAQTFNGGFFTITTTGTSAATSETSARSAIPPNSSGNIPNYIRVAGRNECYVKIGDHGVVATVNDVLVQPADAVVLQVPKGVTHIAYIQGVSAGQVNISPLENS